jgi:hypothetical protein
MKAKRKGGQTIEKNDKSKDYNRLNNSNNY